MCKYICHYFHLGILSPYVRIQKTNNVMFFFLLIIFFQKSKIRNKFFVKCRRRLLMKKSMELDERKPKNKEIVLLETIVEKCLPLFSTWLHSFSLHSLHSHYKSFKIKNTGAFFCHFICFRSSNSNYSIIENQNFNLNSFLILTESLFAMFVDV